MIIIYATKDESGKITVVDPEWLEIDEKANQLSYRSKLGTRNETVNLKLDDLIFFHIVTETKFFPFDALPLTDIPNTRNRN